MDKLSTSQKEIVRRFVVTGVPIDELLQAFIQFPTLRDLIKRNLCGYIQAHNTKTNEIILLSGHNTSYQLGGVLYREGHPVRDVDIHYTVSEERLQRYSELEALGCPVPWYSEEWSLWDQQVIVVERLYPVTKSSNVKAIAIQLLEQLSYVHRFGVYSYGNFGQTKDGRYFLCDMNSCGFTTCKKDLLDFAIRMRVLDPSFAWMESHIRKLDTIPLSIYRDLIEDIDKVEKLRQNDIEVMPIQKLKLNNREQCCNLM
jgi:hypothetical protein